MRAVYPGSFNPPTVGHIEIVNSAINRFKVNEIHLVMSEIALGKEKLTRPSVSDRVEILEKSLSSIPEASVLKTSKQLIADIAEGYDVVILGADKWKQLTELAFYDDEAHMKIVRSAIAKFSALPNSLSPKEVSFQAEIVKDIEIG